jgi:glycosyltransferase involved in cell wall biosynthesis
MSIQARPFNVHGGYGVFQGYLHAYPGITGDWSDQSNEPTPARPLRVTHVGQSMVRAGIENWLKGLMRFLDPSRVRIVKCIATAPEEVDPTVTSEMGVPVEVGGADVVQRAARESDVMLCWGPRQLGEWLTPAMPKLCVVVAHGEGPWTKLIIDGCTPVADHVIAVSRRVEERITTGLPTTVIPNGVDTAHLARTRPASLVRESLGFRSDDFVIGYVGRFSDEKRPHLVAQAVSKLPANFKALFVGWGPLQSRLLDYANRLIPGRYAFVRGVNDVGDYYGAMDAMCLPSEEEGFGLVVLEAMFCDRPVIATPVGCVPELVRDRVNGLVVDGSAESIAAVAMLLHRHPAWARGLAAEGRATAEAYGHARTMARAYENLFLRLWREKFGRDPAMAVAP